MVTKLLDKHQLSLISYLQIILFVFSKQIWRKEVVLGNVLRFMKKLPSSELFLESL